MAKAVGGGLSDDNLAIWRNVEQYITFRRNSIATERLDYGRQLAIIGPEIRILDFENGALFRIGIERLEPLADAFNLGEKFRIGHSGWLCNRHAVGITKGPIQ